MKKALFKIMAITAIATFTTTGLKQSQSDYEVSCQRSQPAVQAAITEERNEKAPKYIFLFIGDGMSYPQIQLTNYYLNATSKNQKKSVVVGDTKKELLQSKNQLSMMEFEIAGSAQTYDRTSFAPDSASTATSIATGYKTWSGSINVSEDFTKEYETIAEKLKAQKNYKIGIISSVNINHATPAAFYAHQASRNNYYEIGLELIESQFDYFAGGGLKKINGSDGKQTDLYQLAEKGGYKVVKTQAEAKKLTKKDGKVLLIDEHLADSDALSYDLDRKIGQWALADYVEKGIELLENENGFFMMIEGGKIDWACHANDAASTISDTIALDNAVQRAVNFYKKHPEETLILVTGDHETGGLTIGYAGTDYDTFLMNLKNQEISYAKFDSDYVTSYKNQKTDFSTVLKDIERLFGLKAPVIQTDASTGLDHADQHKVTKESGSLVMTNYEYNKLKDAYKETMNRTGKENEFTEEEYEAYGSYEPLTVTVTHILNHKSGISFSSYAHTGLPVEVLAKGVGASFFDGYYDNTDIYQKIAKMAGVN